MMNHYASRHFRINPLRQVLPFLLGILFSMRMPADGASGSARQTSAAQDYAIRMAESIIKRNPESYGDWDYVTGTVLKGFEAIWRNTGEPKYFDYIKRTVDSVVDEQGNIRDYDPFDYNIDEIQEGRVLLFLYRETGQDKYRIAADRLRSQLKEHPRTSQGGFWHKKIYPSQMWLDGLYMGSPFYAEYAKLFGETGIFNDVVNQFFLIREHLRDSRTGLYYHAWDESRSMFWADSLTGKSRCYWGRGMGWYVMALVDVLDYLPEDHPGRSRLIGIMQELAPVIKKAQDSKTGLWWQVLDRKSQPGNYLEGSVSPMFVYALAKAVRNGYVDEKYRSTAIKGFYGLTRHLVYRDRNGTENLLRICKSAGLGGTYMEKIRDGSYEYYVYMEPIVPNDGKGLGPYLAACIEIQLIQH